MMLYPNPNLTHSTKSNVHILKIVQHNLFKDKRNLKEKELLNYPNKFKNKTSVHLRQALEGVHLCPGIP